MRLQATTHTEAHGHSCNEVRWMIDDKLLIMDGILERSIYFLFLFFAFSSLSIYLVPNVDLRLDCKKHVSHIFLGVRTLCNCGKECEAFNVETEHVFINAIKSNAHSSAIQQTHTGF